MTWPFLSVFAAFVLNYVPLLPLWWAHQRSPTRPPSWSAAARTAARTGRELFAAFAAGVITSHLAGLDARRTSVLCSAFVLLRVAQIGACFLGLEQLELILWLLSVAAVGGLFLLPLTL